MKQCESCGCHLDSFEKCNCKDEGPEPQELKKYSCKANKKKMEIEIRDNETGEEFILSKGKIRLLQAQNKMSIEKIAIRLEVRIKEITVDINGNKNLQLRGTADLS